MPKSNADRQRELRERRRAQGLCACGDRKPEIGRAWCATCIAAGAERVVRSREQKP